MYVLVKISHLYFKLKIYIYLIIKKLFYLKYDSNLFGNNIISL